MNIKELYNDMTVPYKLGMDENGNDVVSDYVENTGYYLYGKNKETLDGKVKTILNGIFKYCDYKEFEVMIMDSGGSYKEFFNKNENASIYMDNLDGFLLTLDELVEELDNRKNILMNDYSFENWKTLLKENPHLLNNYDHSWITLIVSDYSVIEKEMKSKLSEEDFKKYIGYLTQLVIEGRSLGIKLMVVTTEDIADNEYSKTMFVCFNCRMYYNLNDSIKYPLSYIQRFEDVELLSSIEKDDNKCVVLDYSMVNGIIVTDK